MENMQYEEYSETSNWAGDCNASIEIRFYRSLGMNPMPLQRQSDSDGHPVYVENALWVAKEAGRI